MCYHRDVHDIRAFRSGVNPSRPDVDINGERYWPVKIKRKSTGRTKWANLHEDEPTVRSFVKEAMENAARPNRWKTIALIKSCVDNDTFDPAVAAAVDKRKFLLKRLLEDQGHFQVVMTINESMYYLCEITS